MKRGKTYDWIPLWIDKWIFGSTRIELEPAERSVWTDFMALAAKDDGFIRANEKTGYLPRQLAGMLCISEELLQSSIEKFIKFGKIRDEGNAIYRLVNWEEYSLSERHKRRVMSEKSDMASGSADACISLSLMSKSQSLSLKKGGRGGGVHFDGSSWNEITDEDRMAWAAAYPACDVHAELRKMGEWLKANPTKKKSNYRRFITNWLSRTQDKGGTKGAVQDEFWSKP